MFELQTRNDFAQFAAGPVYPTDAVFKGKHGPSTVITVLGPGPNYWQQTPVTSLAARQMSE